ncbi:MAG: hypothetical protein AW11_03287 [Candidatus Accumulibacter regalis]|uniref:Uncharacterized protein n=1 Tax=Accumulibacter regalis TaxID=522306 RepID=A0A011QA22_ACCRE|nr:MAG: hypothetical protein AW11_03287 [Candidatus Accumulibacter regalis]
MSKRFCSVSKAVCAAAHFRGIRQRRLGAQKLGFQPSPGLGKVGPRLPFGADHPVKRALQVLRGPRKERSALWSDQADAVQLPVGAQIDRADQLSVPCQRGDPVVERNPLLAGIFRVPENVVGGRRIEDRAVRRGRHCGDTAQFDANRLQLPLVAIKTVGATARRACGPEHVLAAEGQGRCHLTGRGLAHCVRRWKHLVPAAPPLVDVPGPPPIRLWVAKEHPVRAVKRKRRVLDAGVHPDDKSAARRHGQNMRGAGAVPRRGPDAGY